MDKKEIRAMRDFHRAAMLSQLRAYNRSISTETAAFEAAAKHAAIFNALAFIAAPAS